MLDLKEAAQEGMGPHGLCVGATGSGKSELLRTLVLGLAVTHSLGDAQLRPRGLQGRCDLRRACRQMPHVAAVITNLADDLTLVDRMRDSITRRADTAARSCCARRATTPTSTTTRRRARRAPPLEPLPSLVLVIDEFSELLTAKPDFIDMFIQIGRIGRSLGVHLLLASQRLEEGRLRGLDTYLSYRIGLRTFSAAESRTAIGVPDAYHLPNGARVRAISSSARTRWCGSRRRTSPGRTAPAAPGRRSGRRCRSSGGPCCSPRRRCRCGTRAPDPRDPAASRPGRTTRSPTPCWT